MSGGNEAWGGTEMQSDCLILLLSKTKKNHKTPTTKTNKPIKVFSYFSYSESTPKSVLLHKIGDKCIKTEKRTNILPH